VCVCVCVCVCVTDLPGAETLEEEIECQAPDRGREQDTHQRQTLDPLTAPQLTHTHTHTK